MYRFLRQPRWIFLLILVPLLVVLFFYLSEWQRERYDGRNEANVVVEQTLAIPAAPLDVVLSEQHTASAPAQWRQVNMSGTYLADSQALVRKKPMHGKVGFWVITPLKLAIPISISAANSPTKVESQVNTVLINRGWIPPSTTPNAAVNVPEPPAGEVSVTGRLQEMQAAETLPGDLPPGQILHVAPAEMKLASSARVAPMYVNLQASNPAQTGDITVLPEPEIDSGPHLSYALQWIAFAVVLVVGIVILVRREARDDDSAEPDEDSPTDLDPTQ